MLSFAVTLVEAAKAANMLVPDDHEVGSESWDRDKYPHFTVFCGAQLERPIRNFAEIWPNAEIIADIPDDLIRSVTARDLAEMGVSGMEFMD